MTAGVTGDSDLFLFDRGCKMVEEEDFYFCILELGPLNFYAR